jgi:hypothetical protein
MWHQLIEAVSLHSAVPIYLQPRLFHAVKSAQRRLKK